MTVLDLINYLEGFPDHLPVKIDGTCTLCGACITKDANQDMFLHSPEDDAVVIYPPYVDNHQ